MTGVEAKRKARLAGAFWMGTIVAGMCSLFAKGTAATVANLAATACYLGATLLVYVLLKPVNKNLSLLAAAFSVVGCTLGVLAALKVPPPINPLAFFGLHCLTVGYLIFRSGFLPRFTGVLLAFGGLGWLTFAVPDLARQLAPYNLFPGIIGEATLSVWLMVVGVNVARWEELDRR